MALLTVEHISKSFGVQEVLQDVSLELHQGELVSLLGISGSGKTTLFNIISGLEQPDAGKVRLENVDITGTSGHVSYMLQKDLLLPYRTILDNVALPLLLQGEKKTKAREKAAVYFEQFGLQGTEHMYPSQLSGGMKQRAAFLRTYLFSGKVALLDEPFSALDMITKRNIHMWYQNVMKQIRLSTIFITHDIDEAIQLSDRIYVLTGKPGKITKEIVVQEEKKEDFSLSERFLEYKKEILETLK